MVAGVNPSNNVFSVSSPFILTTSSETTPDPKTSATILTPQANASSIADIANIFSPAADISKLSPSATSVLLTEQARQKPVILQDLAPRAETAGLGTLDIYGDLLRNAQTFRNGLIRDDRQQNYGFDFDTGFKTDNGFSRKDAFAAYDAANNSLPFFKPVTSPQSTSQSYISSSINTFA